MKLKDLIRVIPKKHITNITLYVKEGASYYYGMCCEYETMLKDISFKDYAWPILDCDVFEVNARDFCALDILIVEPRTEDS